MVELDVVVDGIVVVVSSVVDTSVVSIGTVVSGVYGSVVKAESGTISHWLSSIFHANIKQVPPPFSYIQTSSGTLPA